MRNRTRGYTLVGACAAALLAATAASAPAQADPIAGPQFLSGYGPASSAPLMDGLSKVVIVNGVNVIEYNDPNPSGNPICAQEQAVGSQSGRRALLDSLGTNDGCIQFAGADAPDTTATGTAQLTYVPFATDAIDFAVTDSSDVPRVMDLSDVQQIYQCNPQYVGTPPNYSIFPLLPGPGSGLRAFWETAMGITDAQVTNGTYPCISDLDGHGNVIAENNGLVLANNNIIPFSVASWDAQESQAVPDVRGQSALGVIGLNSAGANAINPSFDVTRSVYNVIPTASENTAPWSTVFNGPSSLICTNLATIEQYGFEANPNCGSTSTVTSP